MARSTNGKLPAACAAVAVTVYLFLAVTDAARLSPAHASTHGGRGIRVSGPPAPLGRQRVLFTDDGAVVSSSGVTVTVNAPRKAGPALRPDRPWESWAVFGYNSVVTVDNGTDTTYRLYYDCISINVTTSGIGYRFTCLAESTDGGVTWTKPELGVASFNGSTANNIVWPLSDGASYEYHEPGAAFVDENPDAPATEKWKMFARWTNPASGQAGTYVLASPDGIRWKAMFDKPSITGSDTFNVGYYDTSLNAYVVWVRHDIKQARFIRLIARCVTTDLSDLGARQDVFGVDSNDPQAGRLDVYTSSATRYYGGLLMFPSMYYHFTPENPWGFHNDGILDIRFITAPNASSSSVGYVAGAWNARRPFVELGANTCAFEGSLDQPGGWCNPKDGSLADTTVDTSAMYMAAGYALSSDGSKVHLFSSAQPMTHGGDAGAHTWQSNTMIQRLELRLDGFVSMDGDYNFNSSSLPEIVTKVVTVPQQSDCPSGHVLQLQANVATGVAGYAAFELLDAGSQASIANFSLADSNRWRGNSLYRGMSWGSPATSSLASLEGRTVSIRAIIPDARLFGLQFGCGSAP